jgi:hypothetical protein
MEFVVEFSKPKVTRLGEAYWNKIVSEVIDPVTKMRSRMSLFFYSVEQHADAAKLDLNLDNYVIETQQAEIMVENVPTMMTFRVIKGLRK